MDSLMKLTYIDMKLYFRNTVAIFFTLVFPLLMLALFGGIYGNQPTDLFGGYGSVDITVPGYIATLVIGTAAFMSLPMDLSTQRQLGVLRRMRATPLHPGIVLASKLISNLLISLIGMALLIIAGRVLFQAHLPVNWPTVLLGILLISVRAGHGQPGALGQRGPRRILRGILSHDVPFRRHPARPVPS